MSATGTTATAATTTAAPSVHRRALITWLAVYPTITLVLGLLGPATAHLPLPLRTLILTAFVVPTAAYGLVPLLTRANAAFSRR
jgi:antibiotic biosynthesis monooxygenase (ABM) superfamily enzyme